MPCHVHHPFSFLNLFAVLGMLFHVTALSDHAQLNQQLEPSSVRHYIEQLHAEKTLNNTALVSKFYREHDFQPFWTGTYAAHSRADELIHVLRTAHLEGLVKPGHYASAIEAQQKLPDEKDRAWLDVLLTDAFLDYAQQAGRGQLDPRSLKEKWRYPLPKVNALSVLEKAFLSNNVEAVLRDLSPQYASYRRLVEARAFYIAIKERGGWPQFAIYGPSLELDTQSEEILLLRKRLQITGDLPANASQLANFGYELQEAVKRFQVRHGLDADGVVGQTTRYALHAPVEKRIQQITANLERWRWLPRDMGDRHIRVNTAAFELQAIENDRSVLSMRVVVGKSNHQTPSFSEDMRYLVLNPYWNVPNKIARDELIPKERAHPGYLSRKNIRVISGKSVLNPNRVNFRKYRGVRNLPIRLRQEPGGRNALGQIKFIFPNKFSVYLHDTPSKSLFSKVQRTFSHGCVRVEDPLRLADYVLGENWNSEAIQKGVDTGKNRSIKLPVHLPVHIVYQTVWVKESGEINFRKDLYHNDRHIMARLPAAQAMPQQTFATNETTQEPLSLLNTLEPLIN